MQRGQGVRFSHYLALRGGIPCTLAGKDSVHSAGVLLPARSGEPIAHFVVDRSIGRFATIYARRALMRAIKRTEKAAKTLGLEDHYVLARCRDQGAWSIKPVMLPRPCPRCGKMP